MTNESPGYTPSWIRHAEPVDSPPGEHLPADTQAILRDNSRAQRLMRDAGLDLDYFAADIVRQYAAVNSLARLDVEESRRAQGARR